jgi:hypothetical protein
MVIASAHPSPFCGWVVPANAEVDGAAQTFVHPTFLSAAARPGDHCAVAPAGPPL